MKLSLLVSGGKADGKVIPIPLAQFLIGRDPQCHLRPASPMVSKRHCALLVRNGKTFVRDLNSTNGTFVNDQQVKGEKEIVDGDRLKLGPLTFVVKLEAKQAADSPSHVPVDKPTPIPPPKVKTETGEEDESIAAMLMELQDETVPASESMSANSTITELPAPAAPEEAPADPDKLAPMKTQAEKPKLPPMASTASAAKALLDKYTKRPRK